MKVAVLQSNYIPWKGYFDIIHDVDRFIFYDDVQFTKNDWRNRNRIKTAAGTQWLTVPVGTDLNRMIWEVRIKDRLWQAKHWKALSLNYGRAPFFTRYRDFFGEIYLGRQWDNLSELNQFLIRQIAEEILGIKTEFRDSREYNALGGRLARLLDLLEKAGADTYVSGPSARDYIDEQEFAARKIRLVYKDYTGYPEYRQLYGAFDHYVSIVDLVFNCGPAAPDKIWGWRGDSGGRS